MGVAVMAFVGAFASASASAAPHYLVCAEVAAGTGHWTNSTCTTAGTGNWETKEVTTALKLEGTLGLSDLKSKIAGTAVTITCKKGKVSGTVETGGKSKATITYEECSIENEAACVVPNIKAKVTDKLIESGGVIEDEFNEEGAGPFTTIVIESCALKSSLEVKGSQICKLPEGEVFKVLHELACEESGSSLKLGKEEAKYKGTASMQLENKEAFKDSK